MADMVIEPGDVVHLHQVGDGPEGPFEYSEAAVFEGLRVKEDEGITFLSFIRRLENGVPQVLLVAVGDPSDQFGSFDFFIKDANVSDEVKEELQGAYRTLVRQRKASGID